MESYVHRAGVALRFRLATDAPSRERRVPVPRGGRFPDVMLEILQPGEARHCTSTHGELGPGDRRPDPRAPRRGDL